jgi:hypothetical protein
MNLDVLESGYLFPDVYLILFTEIYSPPLLFQLSDPAFLKCLI